MRARDKGFSRKDSLTAHRKTHTGAETPPWKEDVTTFNNGGNLEKHTTTHTEEKPSTSQLHSGISTDINLTPSKLEKLASMLETTRV